MRIRPLGKALKAEGALASKKMMLHAFFGGNHFVDNDHARADRALGENGHHRKERPYWREAGSYDAALRSGATISDNAFERLSLI